MIPIVFSTDHDYIMPTGVTICSLLLHEEEGYDIYVLTSPSVTDADKRLLERQVKEFSSKSKISFIDMGTQFAEGYEIRGISTACYYRLMIPWLIPEVDKIIYCDGDIVIKTSLKELYETDLEGKYVAGSSSYDPENWIKCKKYLDKTGLDYKKYINSGVLVINSALQRRDSLDKEYKKLADNKYLYQDQDIINIVCKDRIAYFSYRFNFKPSQVGLVKEVGNDLVIHYAGDKPWRCFTYAWEEWWEAYKKSIFYDGEFYHKICSRILSPKHQMRNFSRKARIKVKNFLSNNI